MGPFALAFIFIVVLLACVLIIIILPEVPTPPSPRNNVTEPHMGLHVQDTSRNITFTLTKHNEREVK